MKCSYIHYNAVRLKESTQKLQVPKPVQAVIQMNQKLSCSAFKQIQLSKGVQTKVLNYLCIQEEGIQRATQDFEVKQQERE